MKDGDGALTLEEQNQKFLAFIATNQGNGSSGTTTGGDVTSSTGKIAIQASVLLDSQNAVGGAINTASEAAKLKTLLNTAIATDKDEKVVLVYGKGEKEG